MAQAGLYRSADVGRRRFAATLSYTAEMRAIDSIDFSALTDREQDVLRLLAHGMTNKDIAEYLGLATGTVRNTIAAIQNRLGVADRTQAALVAYHAGLARTWPVGVGEAKSA